MVFYPPNPRRGPLPPRYRQSFGPPNQGRQEQPYFYPNQGRQGQPYFYPNQGRQGQPYFYPNQGRQEQLSAYPNQQPQPSRFGRFTDGLNTVMGHAGTVTKGVNMVRQMGTFMNLFR